MPISVAGNRRFLCWAPACAGALSRKRESGFTPVRRFAEHGFTPVRRFAEHGFTLVELMIVITIIGLASAVVVLAMPDPRGRLADEAAQFAARTRAAHDLAVVGARPVSVWVSAGGYGFDAREDGTWVAMAEKPLRVTQWSKGTHASPASGGTRDRVVFDSVGTTDRPLDVTLARDTKTVVVHIGTDGEVKTGAR